MYRKQSWHCAERRKIVHPASQHLRSSVLRGLKLNVMKRSRERKLDHFYAHFREGMTVLDVGVSSETRPTSAIQNFFLRTFRYAPECYTGLGIQDLRGMAERYPGKRFVQYAGARFPFDDREFDWVFSNAVIEHVGDERAQLSFLNEMLRVGRNVFFTTPNKYFPVEPHTNLLFLHWNNAIFYWWCKRTNRYVRKHNLHLFSIRRLKRMLAASNASGYTIFRSRLIGLPMTFTMLCLGSGTDTRNAARQGDPSSD